MTAVQMIGVFFLMVSAILYAVLKHNNIIW